MISAFFTCSLPDYGRNGILYQRDRSCQRGSWAGSAMSFQHESSLNMNTLDERLLTVMDVLHTPVWNVYDIQRHHIYWANGSALGLWEASSLAELQSRTSRPTWLPPSTCCCSVISGDFQQDRSYNEWWTLSQRGQKQVYLRLSGIQLAGRQMMMMAEAVIDADTSIRSLPRHRRYPWPACLTTRATRERQPSLRHVLRVAVSRAWPQIFSGADEAFYRRLSRLDEVVAEGSATQKGMRWFQYQFRHIQQARILLTMRGYHGSQARGAPSTATRPGTTPSPGCSTAMG